MENNPQEPHVEQPAKEALTPPPPSGRQRNWLKIGLISVAAIFTVLIIGLLITNPTTTLKEPKVDNGRTAMVEITVDGFVPAELLVEPGTEVTWINTDTEPHYVASNPYPERTEHPELDSGKPIGPDGVYTFTVGDSGSYNYHDAYNPTTSGVIRVNE